MKDIREPVVAGMFYPSSESKLNTEIKFLLDNYKADEIFSNVGGIVSPHAGYIYSGKTAAFAYNAVSHKKIKTVIIISPSHKEYFPGISIYQGGAYKTPLGIVPINNSIREKLTSNSKFIFSGSNGHKNEHAIEVQLPFMQVLFRDFTIVPIVMGDQNTIYVNELSEKLKNIMTDETLIVASSDLSHFYNKMQADELDSVVENYIKDFNYNGLQNDLQSGKCEACGGGAIVAMMKTFDLLGKKKSVILSRTDSGDVSGDDSEVVGYLSAAIYS